MADMKWYGEKIQANIRSEMKRRLSTSAIIVQQHAKELVNVDGTTAITILVKKRSGAIVKKKTGRLIYNTNPSKPGEPPHKQTGNLLRSILWEVDGLAARVGTAIKYGRWLELGTRKMAARPWLRRALAERRVAVVRILTRVMPHL